MTGPGYVLLSAQFGVSVDEVASSFGAIILGLACFMYGHPAFMLRAIKLMILLNRLFQGALAVKFGHRIVYFGSVSLVCW